MRILDLLKPEAIKIGGVPKDKATAIDQMVDLMAKEGNLVDVAAYKKAVLAREQEISTAVENGVAIPHGKSDAVKVPGLAAMTVPGGVDFGSLDGNPTTLVFLIAAPNTDDNVHLQVLSRLSQLLVDPSVCDRLRAAKSTDEFLNVLSSAEEAHVVAEHDKKEETARKAGSFDVVAVTACPTGIAHTYMAAESLENKAKEMGVSIKVETQGAGGAKNVLSAADVAGAKGVVIAADKNVDLSRFDGKPVYLTTVTKGIQEPEVLINKIIKGEAAVYEGAHQAATISDEEGEGAGHVIYKHLMNGVSHMLPFVIGGGILTALAFLFDMSAAGTSSYGSSTTFALFFKTIGSEAFGMMLPILAGYIAMSIADRPGLAPGFVGGLFAKGGYNLSFLSLTVAGDTEGAAAACISGGFLAALFAGFAAGYLMLGIEKMCQGMPKSLEGIKPILIYPLLGVFAIGAIMFLLNPLFGAINTGLNGFLSGMGTTNLVLLGAVVGGMMSIDMGGPFNKAAYVFSTGLLADATLGSAGQIVMASCMVGGMVPPLVIAFSTTFFKNKWTVADRNAGVVNYVMGLSFISEGAIPFAAADPGRVIPSCIIGSAIAGGLSALFGCYSPAPHGGAWVIAVIGNPVMFLVALVVGSAIGAVILSAWKKTLSPELNGVLAK
ncbi:MAG: PTS transporter subunit EIIA [Atopobium sp.]|jgi:PTS system fructose-specific IIC component|nr:PTS transporter subunit EIIA [Atopobium sp.]